MAGGVGGIQRAANGGGPLASPEARAAAERAAAESARQKAINDANAQQVLYGGTSYETTQGAQNAIDAMSSAPGFDRRGYIYGRDPMAAQQAIGKANAIGDMAYAQGGGILQQDTALAEAARNRAAPTGDYGQQNTALGQSLGYGSTLAGLEATQGPSAAQAQLNTGTNQALNSQMALARSGRGFGGNAASMGVAQGNVAGIQANAANQSAMLRAQEDAAWRQRQAGNLNTAAGIAQGAGTQYGQQANANMGAYLQNQAMNDQASLGYLGQGATAYGNGVNQSFAGQSLGHNVNLAQMAGNQAQDDRMLRAWSAERGYQLAEDQADAQQMAAIVGGVATVGGAIAGGMIGGPAGAAAGGAAGNTLGQAAAG